MRKTILISLSLLAFTGHAEEYFTEYFEYRPFDLEGASLTFTRDGWDNYSVQGGSISELPVDPTDHPAFYLADDAFAAIALSENFWFYDSEYSTAYVGSNGYITFGGGDTTWIVSISNHFAQARISTLYDDWQDIESEGCLRIKDLYDRLVVTFLDMPEFGSSGTNNRATFQTELFYADGTIRMSWMNVANPTPTTIVGLSRGDGIPADYSSSDLSSIIIDWDNDGIPDDWEETHFGSPQNCIATNDYDGDLLDNISEYICGSDPRDKNSGFTANIRETPMGLVIEWSAITGRRYSISKSENLIYDTLKPYKDGLLFPQNSYTDTVGKVEGFYKVHVELDE